MVLPANATIESIVAGWNNYWYAWQDSNLRPTD